MFDNTDDETASDDTVVIRIEVDQPATPEAICEELQQMLDRLAPLTDEAHTLNREDYL